MKKFTRSLFSLSLVLFTFHGIVDLPTWTREYSLLTVVSTLLIHCEETMTSKVAASRVVSGRVSKTPTKKSRKSSKKGRKDDDDKKKKKDYHLPQPKCYAWMCCRVCFFPFLALCKQYWHLWQCLDLNDNRTHVCVGCEHPMCSRCWQYDANGEQIVPVVYAEEEEPGRESNTE